MKKSEEIVFRLRRKSDEIWSEHRKLIVAIASCVGAFAILVTGIWYAWASTPPKLPTTVDQAIRVMNSSKYDRLDPDRKQQYAEAALRVMRDIPEDQRREFFRDEDARHAIRTAFMQQIDSMARRVARGESLEEVFGDMPMGPGRGGFGPPGGRRPDGERPERPDGERPDGDGPNAERPGGPDGGGPGGGGNRGQRMAGFMNNMIQTGNAQRGALMGELRQRMRAEREAQGDR